MENWIKNNLEELEITPKSGNWAQISDGLGGEKKNKKRFFLILFLSLTAATLIFSVVWSTYSKPVTELITANTEQKLEIKEANPAALSEENDTSISAIIAPGKPVIDTEGVKAEYLESTKTTSKVVDTQIAEKVRSLGISPKEKEISKGIKPGSTEGVVQSEGANLVSSGSKETDGTSTVNRIEVNDVKWTHSLEQKIPELAPDDHTVVGPKVDLRTIGLAMDSMVDSSFTKNKKSWKSLLIPDRVYTEYQRGSYINYPSSYLDITENAVNSLDLGIGYAISPRFGVDFGIGSYVGSVTSYVGDKVAIRQIDYNSIGTSSPPEGFNSSMDTLSVSAGTLYDELRQKDLYLKGQTSTVTQTVSGYRIPISLSYKLAEIHNFNVKTQIGMTFNLVNDYSSLTYLEDFQVMVNNPKESNGLTLGSYTLRGGLLAEYRPHNLGVFVSASLALNKSARLSKSILTDSYQSSIGLGFNYYLNTK
jgi:hypothetical protein